MNSFKNIQTGKLFFLISLFVVLGLSYGNIFNHQFILDDYKYFVANNLHKMPVFQLWSGPFEQFFRPVSFTLFKLEEFIFGQRAFFYHLFILRPLSIVSPPLSW